MLRADTKDIGGLNTCFAQFTNALWDTEAWHTIITGSVLTPRMMHLFAHVQVLLTLSALSWIRAGFRESREDADEKQRM
jgi:hypothetical protein